MGEEKGLVLGGTSLVGRFLLQRLASGGQAVAAVSRAPPQETYPGVRWIAADLAASSEALPQIAAPLVYSLSPLWLLPQVLPRLIDGGARRVVAFSSTSRFTKINSPVAEERAVAESLAMSEDAVMTQCAGAGVAWTILRPTLIYAEGRDANVTRLAGIIRKTGFLPLCGDGAGLRQPVHADDLAGAAVAAASAKAAENKAYDLVGAETLTYRGMSKRIFEGLGRRPIIVSVPEPLWRSAFKLFAPFLPGATVGMGLRMNEDLIFNSLEAQRDFSWRPRAFHPNFLS